MHTILYLATHNHHKVKEMQHLFEKMQLDIEISSIEQVKELKSLPEVKETESTFLGNARLKAHTYFQSIQSLKNSSDQSINQPNWFVLADDSGLEVDALHGEPGVLSARYAGNKATSLDNNKKLLQALEHIPYPLRTSRFICVLVLISSRGQEISFKGACEGHIALQAKGNLDFGYDPLFIPKGYGSTFAELGPDIKNQISHRFRALAQIGEHLKHLL